MDTLSRHSRVLRTTVAALGCSALLLTGCTGQEDAPTATETVTDTVTDTVEASPAPDDAACGEAPENPLTGDVPVPVRFAQAPDNSDVFFHYSVSEDESDPCAPLSWVILNGGNGTTENPNGTAGSSRQTVVFFADGEVVTDPAPILARRIESVERVDDSTARVEYAFYTDAPAAADETAPGAATFHWNGSELEVSDNTVPVELNESAETLDLGAVL